MEAKYQHRATPNSARSLGVCLSPLRRDSCGQWVCDKCGCVLPPLFNGELAKAHLIPQGSPAWELTPDGPYRPAAPKAGEVFARWRRAMLRFVAAAIRGQASYLRGFAYRRRLALCRACPKRIGNRCSLCGCVLRGPLAKARMSTEQCPRGKWPGDDPVKPCGCGG